MILDDKIGWFQKNDEQSAKVIVLTSTFFFWGVAELDLCELLYIWFLLILIQAHWVAAALIIYLQAQSWLFLWFYMPNLKGLLFQYVKDFLSWLLCTMSLSGKTGEQSKVAKVHAQFCLYFLVNFSKHHY